MIANAQASLKHRGKTDAPSAGIDLHFVQLWRHGGFAMRRNVELATVAKILHPLEIVSDGRRFDDGQRKGQVAFQKMPVLISNVGQVDWLMMTWKPFE
jgi:hypothetical protein